MQKTVAEIILDQLGGGRFIAMTGAKHFIRSDALLAFKLPSTPGYVRKGINAVRITLMRSDTYTVTFSRVGKLSYRTLVTLDDIYAENLQEVFRRETGLATHL